MSIKDLKEKRQNIFELQKDIYAPAKKEERSMNEDERKQYDAYEKDYGNLTLRIQEAEAIEAKEAEEARSPETILTGDEKRIFSNDPEQRKAQHNEAFDRFTRGKETQEDRDLMARMENRVQTVGTTTQGGFLVPEGYSNQLSVQRALWGGMRQACTIWKTATGQQIPYPTLDDTSNTADTASESGDLTTSADDLVFGEKTFNAYKINSNLLKVSAELMEDSFFDMQGLMVDAFGRRLGTKENALFTTGSGSSTPNGIANAAQQSSRIASTSTVTRSEIIDLVHSVDQAYRSSPKAYFMFNDSTLAVLKKLDISTSDGRGLWEPSLVAGEPDKIDGKPYIINQNVASLAADAKFMYFGDFGQYIIRDSGSTRFKRLNERFADTDQVGFVALARIDGDILVNSAVKYLIGATS